LPRFFRDPSADDGLKPADVFEWYSQLKGFPKITEIAKILMSVPATSVSSERLFSEATRLYSNKMRNRLGGEKAEQILLIKSSLKNIQLAPCVEDIEIEQIDDS
jgi:hypothetical protein